MTHEPETPQVEAFNIKQGIALLENGETIPITQRLPPRPDRADGSRGFFTAGPSKAGLWYLVDMDEFERTETH